MNTLDYFFQESRTVRTYGSENYRTLEILPGNVCENREHYRKLELIIYLGWI